MKCTGVDVTILQEAYDSNGDTYHYLGGMTPLEARLLGKCLGDADGEEVYSASDRVLGEGL